MWSSLRWPARALGLGLLLAPWLAALAHPLMPGAQLRGEAIVRFWGFTVYHAQLWSPAAPVPDKVLDMPFLLQLEYARAFKGQQIGERSWAEIVRANEPPAQVPQAWRETLLRLFPDVQPGDRIAGLNQPGMGIRFWLNERPIGSLADPELSRAFWGIWLAKTTSEPAMRAALLGTPTGAVQP